MNVLQIKFKSYNYGPKFTPKCDRKLNSKLLSSNIKKRFTSHFTDYRQPVVSTQNLII